MDLKNVFNFVIKYSRIDYRLGGQRFLNTKYKEGPFSLDFKNIIAYGKTENPAILP